MPLDIKSYATVTNLLIFLITLAFIIQTLDDGYREAFRFSIDQIFDEPYRLFTHLFLHGNLLHLFQNMYALFIFGNLLESRTNRAELLKLFFLGGLAGAASQVFAWLLGFDVGTTAIGASDAVSAIFGACVLLAMDTNIEVFFIRMKIRTALLLFLLYEALGIFGIFSPYPNVAHAAHLGPFVFGYLYARFSLHREKQVQA